MEHPDIEDPTFADISAAMAGVAVFVGSLYAISPWELGDWAFLRYLISFFLGVAAFWIVRAGITLTDREYRKNGLGSAALMLVVLGVIGFSVFLSWPYLYDTAKENLGTMQPEAVSTRPSDILETTKPTKPFEERLAEPTKPEIQTESPFNKRERELLDMTIRGLKQPLTAREENHLSIELLAGAGYSKTQLQQMSLDEL